MIRKLVVFKVILKIRWRKFMPLRHISFYGVNGYGGAGNSAGNSCILGGGDIL